ncbi:hypothetical protein HMPREF3227_00633 [Corynebacterium sp. CMW7794]|nr:hypothetical protein HMPREF3227_00633 [Corynebacterium sp. CMW7794]
MKSRLPFREVRGFGFQDNEGAPERGPQGLRCREIRAKTVRWAARDM